MPPQPAFVVSKSKVKVTARPDMVRNTLGDQKSYKLHGAVSVNSQLRCACVQG